MWRCGIGTSNRLPRVYHVWNFGVKLWNSDSVLQGKKNASRSFWQKKTTLQGINISHLGKRKIIFNMPFLGDMLVPWRVLPWQSIICQHFPKNVNALLFQQRRGIMISSSSCAREPSWENDVCPWCFMLYLIVTGWRKSKNMRHQPPNVTDLSLLFTIEHHAPGATSIFRTSYPSQTN